MNFFSKFSSAPRAAPRPPRVPKGPRLVAVWTVDPRTGKPKRSWRLASDADGSCRRRPGGPRRDGRDVGKMLPSGGAPREAG